MSSIDDGIQDFGGEADFWSNLETDLPYILDAGESFHSGFSYLDNLYTPTTSLESEVRHPFGYGEGEAFEYGPREVEESETSESSGEKSSESTQVENVLDMRRKSLFVHSCPSHFSDINRARKSVFGSIFLRTTGRPVDESAVLKTVTDSNYSMLQSLLNSFERILAIIPSDSDKTRMVLAYKESILRMLENHGIRKTYSDGNVHWDIYPISQSYLFTIQVDDHTHQTRNLSRMEERIISGATQSSRTPFDWPTGSVWSGHWDGLGMSGYGTYSMPHGVVYSGKMKDGVFHDENATLTYPNKFKAINCVYEKGELKDCQFQFPDLLLHEKENWKYCKLPDRRFWSEVRKGFKPAKIAQKTELDPPRRIPAGCYDTNDGFYNPKTFALTSAAGEMIRVPVHEEAMWIRKYCRKGFLQPTGFRPDLFENWYNYDVEFINEILKQHELFRSRKITYDELQQFYADHDMLSPHSKYKKNKSPSEIELEEYMKALPEPVKMPRGKKVKKFVGHQLFVMVGEDDDVVEQILEKSKSSIKFHEGNICKGGGAVNQKISKINFMISKESLQLRASGTSMSAKSYGSTTSASKSIPYQFMAHQPIRRPPFMEKKRIKPPKPVCPKTPPDDDPLDAEADATTQKKRLFKFMKEIILDWAMVAILEERERQKKRLQWAKKVPHKKKAYKQRQERRCLEVLNKLFESIPDKEEFADSDPSRTCNFVKLAEDKYNVLKYWGKRLFTLDIND